MMCSKFRFSLFALFLLFNQFAVAQYQTPPTAADMYLALQKLNTVGSVLYIAAHPDDENTRLLSYLSKETKVRTGYLSITRGDGGQNLIGKEQGEMLGLIRTQELLAARRTDGAEQFFTRAFDFGYSKTPEETFNFWNKDSVLSDMVWVIRNFKPDVMICRFPTTGEGGHGHHTASAILAVEAFDAAADPSKFSWQLKYTQVWQAKRIFWNTFNFGTTNTTSENQLKFDVGIYNPLLGKSYGEIAAESRSNHKSQGFGSARQRGNAFEYFKLLKGDSCTTSVLQNIDITWGRIKNSAAIQTLINKCINDFKLTAPQQILPQLVQIHKAINELPGTDFQTTYWKKIKLDEVEKLIEATAGLWFECTADDYSISPGDNFLLKCELVNRSSAEVELLSLKFENAADTTMNKKLTYNENLTIKHRFGLSDSAPFSNPYWLNENRTAGSFTINNKLLIGRAENEHALHALAKLKIDGYEINLNTPIAYKSTDPVKGEVYRPVEILPPITLNFLEHVYAFTDEKEKTIDLVLKSNKDDLKGKLNITLNGFDLSYDSDFSITKKGDELVKKITLKRNLNSVSATIEAAVQIENTNYNKSIKRVNYDHIPAQFVLSNAEAKVMVLNTKKTGLKIGYIPGAGDEIPACLKQIGYEVTELNDFNIENDNLSIYNAIVTGVRAYNTNERLQVYHPKLMEYIKNGGNLIVQYNTNNRIGPVKAVIGPYPFTISRERVTNENATVNMLLKEHTAFNYPNKITAANFENWIQERGIYFVSDLDSNYQNLISMADPGEEQKTGSLITAKYGKGNFVYTGVVFFRELPAGVEGAYQLFINLLSLPQNK